jgi:hypothetical protein
MSVTIHFVRSCDRCSAALDTVTTPDKSKLPDIPERQVFKMTFGEHVLFAWEDLCPKCKKAVDNLVDRIRLVNKKDDTATTPNPVTEAPPADKAEEPF